MSIDERRANIMARIEELRAYDELLPEHVAEIEKLEYEVRILDELEDVAEVVTEEQPTQSPVVADIVKGVEETPVKGAENMNIYSELVEKIKATGREHGFKAGTTTNVAVKAPVTYTDTTAPIPADYEGSKITGADYGADILSLFNVVDTDSNAVNALLWDFTNVDFDAVADGGLKPEGTPNVAPLATLMKKVGGHIKVSESVLADDPGLARDLERRLARVLVRTRNKELLAGDGTGAHMLGLANASGIQTVTRSGNLWDDIADAMSAITDVTDLEADTLILSPADWATLVKSKESGNGAYYIGSPNMAQLVTPWGIANVAKSRFVSDPIVGAFGDGATVYRRSDINVDVTNSNEDDFVHDLLTMRVWQRLALAVEIPQAFATIKNA